MLPARDSAEFSVHVCRVTEGPDVPRPFRPRPDAVEETEGRGVQMVRPGGGALGHPREAARLRGPWAGSEVSHLSPVTPFSSLHGRRRRPHGGLLCRWTSNGHSAQGLLTAIRLGIQGMQVCLPVLLFYQNSVLLNKSRGERDSGCQAPGRGWAPKARLREMWGAGDPHVPPLCSHGPCTGLRLPFPCHPGIAGHPVISPGCKQEDVGL